MSETLSGTASDSFVASSQPKVRILSTNEEAIEFAKSLIDFHADRLKQNPEYSDSWKKRGMIIAYCNLDRKLERLDSLVQGFNNNLFSALKSAKVQDCYKDILVYIMLHAAEADAEGHLIRVAERNKEISNDYGIPWALTKGWGAWADVSRKIDSLRRYAASHDFELLGRMSGPHRDSKAWEAVSDLTGYMLMAAGQFRSLFPKDKF